MKTCKHIALFSIVAVCMLVMQIPFAFAYSSGAASVSVSDNSVSAEYTSVDLYIKDGSTYSQITSNSFSDGTLGYTATTTGNVTTYSFSSTSIKLSCDNLYVMILCSDTEKRFGLDPVITESWLASAEITLTLKVGDEPSRSVTINSAGTKYVFYRSGSSLSTANSLNNVTWMQYSGNVTITLAGLAQNTLFGSASVSVKLVFQK